VEFAYQIAALKKFFRDITLKQSVNVPYSIKTTVSVKE
jgi:hypothetical protein